MKQPNHAQEIRAVRRGRNQDRQDQVERLRNLHGSDETQAKAQTKPLGSLGRVKAPLLHHERDRLFEKYLYAVDQYLHFITLSIGQPLARRQAMSLYRHIEDLNIQLQRYDERINASTTTGPLLY